MDRKKLTDKVKGCLLGGLIGDAMGAPVENWNYWDIEEKYGEISDFEGSGTDDSAVKLILCEALIHNKGHITADEFAEHFLKNPQFYDLFFVPVRNMYHKLQNETDLPVHAGINNTASSSSVMSISPMGIVNACDPRTAAREAYAVAGLIHSCSTSFCRDAASAMAAAVAEAVSPNSTVDSVLKAAVDYLHPKSAKLMKELILDALQMARDAGEYQKFREIYYQKCLYPTICDSRETVPATFALFYLADGDASKCIIYGANFGRDSDTIASMLGALAGAYQGISGLRTEWVEKVLKNNPQQEELAQNMEALVWSRYEEKRNLLTVLDSMR